MRVDGLSYWRNVGFSGLFSRLGMGEHARWSNRSNQNVLRNKIYFINE